MPGINFFENKYIEGEKYRICIEIWRVVDSIVFKVDVAATL